MKVGIEILKTGHMPGRLQHAMIFTDGLPNINPPRGIVPMLKRHKDKEGGGHHCLPHSCPGLLSSFRRTQRCSESTHSDQNSCTCSCTCSCSTATLSRQIP